MAAYKVEILDNTLTAITLVQAMPALDKQSTVLKYTRKLSDWGTCKFRVGTKDPLFVQYGDILKPFANHVRVSRNNAVVWQGVIVKNPTRSKNYIEVEAYTYLYLLSRVLIRHDAADGNGGENYRTLKSGTMATAIQTILTEAKADMGKPITNLTIGTIDNPTFPADYKDSAGATLSGAWTFSNTFQLKFDYRDVLYFLQTLGAYSNFDFELTDAMVFNFKSYIGNKQPDLQFTYGEFGNIEDYNAPLDGDAMANYLQGVAADNNFTILHAEESAPASINTYGKIMAVAPYADVKNVNLLRTRLREELTQVQTPDPELHITLNDRSYPLGQWGLGDTISINIQDHVISTNSQRRIVGYVVDVHTTGKETIRVITNKPRNTQA